VTGTQRAAGAAAVVVIAGTMQSWLYGPQQTHLLPFARGWQNGLMCLYIVDTYAVLPTWPLTPSRPRLPCLDMDWVEGCRCGGAADGAAPPQHLQTAGVV
jgi:hypothetical protein